jgi:N-acetylneuraminate synthase
MHSKDEIKAAKKRYNYKNIKWLYCQSLYPTPLELVDYKEMANFDGFSDHTIGIEAIRNALDLMPNIQLIEKHFILSKFLPSRDKDWSIEPGILRILMSIIKYNEAKQNYKTRWVG